MQFPRNSGQHETPLNRFATANLLLPRTPGSLATNGQAKDREREKLLLLLRETIEVSPYSATPENWSEPISSSC
jgi:hypothetical protein